ncbi:hypothetical protein J6590_053679 [Homalodisca vitripennis]|nr:hypothetical protein J6590_053679 [Homalodisca vitripennis]
MLVIRNILRNNYPRFRKQGPSEQLDVGRFPLQFVSLVYRNSSLDDLALEFRTSQAAAAVSLQELLISGRSRFEQAPISDTSGLWEPLGHLHLPRSSL